MCVLHMWVGHGTTAVESNMKREHNLYLACEESPQRAFFFLLFSSCPLSFYCTLTSLLSFSQCRKLSAAFSTRFRKTRTLWRTNCVVLLPLSRSAVLPSLVPRPCGRREKWPGIHCLRMRENPHDFMGYRIPSFTNR